MGTILTCRVCMTDFALPEGLDLLACPACGAMHSRPQAEGDALDKLQRGTRLRLARDFAAAEKCYDHVLMDHDDEHEALWGRLLCLYGVEHVVDPKTGVRHPLVHCPRRKPLQEQADFRHACELAPAEVRAQYEADAAYIDDAQAEIRSLAQKCPPYDVFICHKTTRMDSDAKTEDYNRAFMLYHKLDKLGYRVFFAPVEMEGVAAGANYEAAIYHALHTARVMLVICSDPAYISSTWVQSEWKRYLELVDDHADRCLLPLLYGSLPAGKLPREYRLRKIEAVTMEGWDAQENVLKVLGKFCGEKGAAKPAPAQPQLAPVPPQPVPVQKPSPVAYYSPEGHFQTKAIPGGCVITKYTGPGGQVDIPPAIGGMPVAEIGTQAFWQCEALTGVAIPDSVTAISEYAFGNCYGLTQILIPKNVKRIGSNPFSGCSALRSITVEDGNAEFYVIEDMLFSRDGTLLCLPAGLGRTKCDVPPCVRIGEHAFNSNRLLTDVSIREGTTEIGTYAFSGCSALRSLHIPASVTKIGINPCTWCSSLRSVTVAANNPQYRVTDGVVFTADMSVLVFYPAGLPAADYRIPASVEIVNTSAFADCKNLRSVTFHKGVKRIGTDLFKRCENVTMRVYPGTEAHIYAHQNKIPCEQLKEEAPFEAEPCEGGCMLTRYTGPADCDIRLPERMDGKPVVDAGMTLFPDDEHPIRAGYIGLPATLKSFCAGTFRGVRPQAYAVMKDNPCFYSSEGVVYGTAGNYLAVYPSGSKRTEYTIREGTKYVFDWGFRYAENLTTLTMPASLKQIRSDAMSECPKLRSVTLPEGLERIDKYAFWNCPSLTTLTIPAGTAINGEGVFGKCPNLTLRVHEGSPAHEYARANKLRFEVIQRAGAADNAPKTPEKSVSQPAKPVSQPAKPAEISHSELLITRSKRMDGAVRKIAVRIDGKEVGQVANGESFVVKLNPGTHRVDIKLKPLLGGDVHWDSMWTVKDIFKENMLPGKRYTIDLADWLRKLFI